jgi:transcriptional regulator with XRE-family HTH domain
VSTNTVKDDLLVNLEDKEYRDLFVEQHINRTVAFQIRATREAQEMRQVELGHEVNMAQGRISLLEDPNYGNFTINTLKRIASALDVALIVRFVPFTQLATWVAGAQQVIPGLSSESLAVPKFEDDIALLKQRKKDAERVKKPLPKAIRDMIDTTGQTPPSGLSDKKQYIGIEKVLAQSTGGH